MSQPSKSKPSDERAKAVGGVWRAAIAMLALSIPLCAILRSAMIPIAVIVGAALVTLYVWSNGGAGKDAEPSENEALREKIKELEERLANVEVINRFEDRLAEKQLRKAQEGTAGDDASPTRTGLKN